jgi:ABC-type glycerol-3-phosphate transport system substrate-binding protein
MQRTRLTAIIAVAAFALTACGGDDDATMSAEALATAFRDQGAPDAEADCMADAMGGKFSKDDIDDFFNAANPDDVNPDLFEAFGEALGNCAG